jgi:hypothetical protein
MKDDMETIFPSPAKRNEDPTVLREALDDAQGSLRAIRSVLAPLLGVPEDSDPADVLVARYVASRGDKVPTFEEVWVAKVKGGHDYDEGSLDLVRYGWHLREQAGRLAAKAEKSSTAVAELCPPTKPGGEP